MTRREDQGVNDLPSRQEKPISQLRRRMIEDMSVRNFVEKTRNDYIRHVRIFTAFLGRSPDTAMRPLTRCKSDRLPERMRTTRISENRIAASKPNRRTGCNVTSTARS